MSESSELDPYMAVKAKLDELGIKFQLVEHPPATTTELADKYIEGIDGVRTKTMFLTNRKKTAYYMLIMDDAKRLDMKRFGELVGAKGIKLASADDLCDRLGLCAGVVSPFGLMNERADGVVVYLDREMTLEERLSFHPNTNDKTIFIATSDTIKFIEAIGHRIEIVDL